MTSVTVSAVVARPQHEVFDHLAVPADHAAFIDHMLTDFDGVIRRILRHGNQRALDRLAALLEPAAGESPAAAAVS